MASFASVRRLFGRLLGRAKTTQEPLTAPPAEIDAVLDGARAVAITEACVAEAAGLSPSLWAADSARSFRHDVRHEAQRAGANLLGQAVSTFESATPRGALSTAVGLAMSGVRATTFVSGSELMSGHDQVALAAGRHLPLVIHLTGRAAGGTGTSLGTGHEAYHAVSEAGCFQLMACNVQEAVDLTLVARRVAEAALVPGLIAIDGDQTAASTQDVRLATLELVREFLGDSAAQIESPTPAQKLLFGEQRRRVPRWHDLERPVLHGAMTGSEAFGLAAAGQRPFFFEPVADLLEDALATFGARTGRHYDLLAEHTGRDAECILITQGSSVETARALADHLHANGGPKLGVIGVRSLRPFPAARLAEVVRGRAHLLVLERADGPLAGEPPLLREVRGAIARALENGRFGPDIHPGFPPMQGNETPRVRSVIYGQGGAPLRGADLAELCRTLSERPSQVWLGVDFAPDLTEHAKRQAAADALRDAYEGLDQRGVRATSPLDLRNGGAQTIAVHRLAGQETDTLLPAAAELLHQVLGGPLRSRVAHSWDACDAICVDTLTHVSGAGAELRDPGDEVLVDVALAAMPRFHRLANPAASCVEGGVLVIESPPGAPEDVELWTAVPKPVREAIAQRQLKVIAAPSHAEDNAAQRRERLLGALMGALAGRSGTELTERRIFASRLDALGDEPHGESRLQAFREGLEGIYPLDMTKAVAQIGDERRATTLPLAVRHIRPRNAQIANALDSLPRFWNQVGVPYDQGRADSLLPDPHLASGAVPALTSTFRDLTDCRRMLPAFDASVCTGCGRCWVACPDGAIGPVVISAAGLVEAGMAIAKEGGAQTDALRQVLSKLGPIVNAALKKAPILPVTARELLWEPFNTLLGKVPLPDDRKAAMQTAFEAVINEIGPVPIARTDPFFNEPESEKRGAGELVVIAINPDACKGCGACVAVCDPEALVPGPQRADTLTQAQATWRCWEAMPDTSGETIARAAGHPDVGQPAAMLLSRHCLLAMASGDGAEPGAGPKTALRLTLATAEFGLQRQLQRHLDDVKRAREQIAARLEQRLTDGLPTDQLGALGAALDTLGQQSPKIGDLMSLIDQAGGERAGNTAVDAPRLQQLVKLGQSLADLEQRLVIGRQGLGRSRLGMVIAPDGLTRGIGVFPYNPFQVPVTLDDSGEAASLARGLIEGQVRAYIDGLRLLRQAELALSNPTEALLAQARLERLTWADLTDEERRLCPPLLVVGSAEAFDERALMRLLSTDLPIKVLVLGDAGAGVAGLQDRPASAERGELGLLALTNGRAFALQSSISHGAHLAAGLARAFDFAGPALVHVCAPSPHLHGFDADRAVAQAQLAVETRAFPLFLFDPAAEGVLGLRLSLEGNPEPNADWVKSDAGADLTPAHWALTESRFESHFHVLPDDATGPTATATWSTADTAGQRGKSPFVDRSEIADAAPVRVCGRGQSRLGLAPALAALTARRAHGWRVLQELAGWVTPFTERVQAEAEAALATSHGAAMANLKQESEQKLAELRAELTAEMAQRVRDRLLAMAGYGPSGSRP